MIRYSTRPSRLAEGNLTLEEDTKLRNAFGRFAKEEFREAGAEVVFRHQELSHWLLCDCRPEAERPPTLFPVDGRYIKREAYGDEKTTHHHEECIFVHDPEDQIKLVQSYCSLNANDDGTLNLVRPFNEDSIPTPQYEGITTPRLRLPLARLLCTLLHDAGLDRFAAGGTPASPGGQLSLLRQAASRFSLSAGQSLDQWLAMGIKGISGREYEDLKKRLNSKPVNWLRPHGLFIGTFEKIDNENKLLVPNNGDPVPVIGKLSVFGEGRDERKSSRPPYLVIGLITHPTRDAQGVEVLSAYAHPCVAWNRLTLVDSQLERETLGQLFMCRNRLTGHHGVQMTIEKPVLDVRPQDNSSPRQICLPDFILRCRGPNVRHETIVVETMGYDDDEYRQRKLRTHVMFRTIGDGPSPTPIVEHDRYKPGQTREAIDEQFHNHIIAAVLQSGPGSYFRPGLS